MIGFPWDVVPAAEGEMRLLPPEGSWAGCCSAGGRPKTWSSSMAPSGLCEYWVLMSLSKPLYGGMAISLISIGLCASGVPAPRFLA